jgi:hypothetical protein
MTLPRHAEIWLADYLWSMIRARRVRKQSHGVVDILFAVTDHFEPLHGGASLDTGLRRVKAWLSGLPAMASPFLDADGRHPQHSFFYPIEQYRPELLDMVATLCGRGFGEVEVHLHHDVDTADRLRTNLEEFTETLHHHHNLLSRDSSGRIRYGFIHGNWALDNSLPDGRWCGVEGELAVLRDTGCYADFTLPAAPSPAQTRTVNQVYYAAGGRPGPKAHDRGMTVAVGRTASPGDLLLVQGPLAAHWGNTKWLSLPHLDNGSLHAGYPPTIDRFSNWLSCRIGVAGRPEWVFVKVYTHGGPERNAEMLLGPQMAAFHRNLLATYNDGERFRLHYVTAREMVNIVHAAEDEKTGNPGQYRDYRFPPPALAGSRRCK